MGKGEKGQDKEGRQGKVEEKVKEKVIRPAGGNGPGNGPARPGLLLDPAMRADAAVKLLLRADLAVIQECEQYIKQDAGIKYLHDFRVALRRTRSVLNQFKGIFSAAELARFKADFREVAQVTSELRDLDVCLLAEPTYRAMLPNFLQEDIGPLFAYLRQKRAAALEAVIEELRSRQYRQLMADWQAFLQMPSLEATSAPNAARSISELAREAVFQRYRFIVKERRRIVANSDDERLHTLRIECKKLRYLMEMFVGLFPPDKTNVIVIKQLRKVQNNLGRFNDLQVQKEYLLTFAVQNDLPRRTALATGALVAALHEEQEQEKAAFAARKNRRLFQKSFGKQLMLVR